VKRRAAAGRKTTLHYADGEKLRRIISGQLLEIVAEIERQQPAKAGARDTASRLVAMNAKPPVREEASC
jgi:hypothetical protein